MHRERTSRYLNPLGGQPIDTPYHWASNEVWPTDVLGHLSASVVRSAVLVGSSNFCSIAPLLDGLVDVTFVDEVPGQMHITRSRVLAARQTVQILDDSPLAVDQASSYISGVYYPSLELLQPYMGMREIIGQLGVEEMTFDFERMGSDQNRLHYLATANGIGNTALLDIERQIVLREVLADVTKPELAHTVRPEADMSGSLDWVHVSNVAPVCFPYEIKNPFFVSRKSVEDAAIRTAQNVVEFVCGINGANDETLVTFANSGQNYVPNLGMYLPTVGISRLGSLKPEQLVTEADIRECSRIK